MKKAMHILRVWGFPLVMALVYWIFDATLSYVNPSRVDASWLEAVFPPAGSMTFTFRLVMTVFTIYGAWLFERSMTSLHRIRKQLYLSEFAIENTKAFEMIWCDGAGKIIKANKFAADRLGYTKEELLKLSVSDISPYHTPETWGKLREVLRERGEAKYITKHRRKDGSMISSVIHIQFLKATEDEYQFAFVHDAWHCPMVTQKQVTPCGLPPIPNMPEFLGVSPKT